MSRVHLQALLYPKIKPEAGPFLFASGNAEAGSRRHVNKADRVALPRDWTFFRPRIVGGDAPYPPAVGLVLRGT